MNMGLFGGFVVKEKIETTIKEHVMFVHDYSNKLTNDYYYVTTSLRDFKETGAPFSGYPTNDGSATTFTIVTSSLINGRGRVYDENGQTTNTPLTVFEVEQGKIYRFRVLSTSFVLQHMISVDDHPLKIVAIDGHDIYPSNSDMFIAHSGERFDFILEANKTVGNYWIRADSTTGLFPGRAVLRYIGAPIADPSSTNTSKQCTEVSKCKVINCPFQSLPTYDCLHLDKLQSPDFTDPAPTATPGKLKEFFINFGFGLFPEGPKGVANGVRSSPMSVSALTQPREVVGQCTEADDCGVEKTCKCLKPLNIEFGDVVQINLLNIGFFGVIHHAIHLHGYSFHVMKIGYRQTNASLALLGHNTDIDCGGIPDESQTLCNNARWSDPS